MERIIKMLEENGHLKAMQNSIDMGFYISGEEPDDYSLVVKKMIMSTLENDEELCDVFIEVGVNLVLDEIVKRLDLKVNKDYQPDEMEKQIAKIAALATIFGFGKDDE